MRHPAAGAVHNHDLELKPFFTGSCTVTRDDSGRIDAGYEHDACIQRIRNAWTCDALFNPHDDLLTAAVTTAESRTSYMLIMIDMTWLKDERPEAITVTNPAEQQSPSECVAVKLYMNQHFI